MWSSLIWAIFLLIVIWLFKKPLLDLLTNIGNKSKKISCMGFDIDLGSSSSLSTGNQLQIEPKDWAFSKAHQSQLITNEEKTIRSQLIDIGASHEQAINILIYQLANNIFLVKLLSIRNLIFPEQLRLLTYLNTCIKPSSCSDLQHYYFEWKERTKNTDYMYDQFISFLSNHGLILWTMDGYIISLLGKEYLSFLIKRGDI
jgi:hypothetical protein